jgi:hypothetical protein
MVRVLRKSQQRQVFQYGGSTIIIRSHQMVHIKYKHPKISLI